MPPKYLNLALRSIGYTLSKYRPQFDPFQRLIRVAKAHGVSVVLDVGANRGQFAKKLFKAGYSGRVVSFEPLAEAHAKLQNAAAGKKNWQVYRRCALGSRAGRAQINVAGNSQSSSFLPMHERHLRIAPHSLYVGIEEVEMLRLDQVIASDFPGNAPLGLKMDVQGYEREVLAGLREHRDRVVLVYAELSLAPLYEGEPPFAETMAAWAADGLRCVSITPNFVDPETFEMLDVNVLFVSDRASAT
jgi:FkbM family methyltransferase